MNVLLDFQTVNLVTEKTGFPSRAVFDFLFDEAEKYKNLAKNQVLENQRQFDTREAKKLYRDRHHHVFLDFFANDKALLCNVVDFAEAWHEHLYRLRGGYGAFIGDIVTSPLEKHMAMAKGDIETIETARTMIFNHFGYRFNSRLPNWSLDSAKKKSYFGPR